MKFTHEQIRTVFEPLRTELNQALNETQCQAPFLFPIIARIYTGISEFETKILSVRMDEIVEGKTELALVYKAITGNGDGFSYKPIGANATITTYEDSFPSALDRDVILDITDHLLLNKVRNGDVTFNNLYRDVELFQASWDQNVTDTLKLFTTTLIVKQRLFDRRLDKFSISVSVRYHPLDEVIGTHALAANVVTNELKRCVHKADIPHYLITGEAFVDMIRQPADLLEVVHFGELHLKDVDNDIFFFISGNNRPVNYNIIGEFNALLNVRRPLIDIEANRLLLVRVNANDRSTPEVKTYDFDQTDDVRNIPLWAMVMIANQLNIRLVTNSW